MNSRLVLHIVRRKDPVVQGSSFSFLHDVSISDASSWIMDTLSFVSVHACSCTGECPSAGGGGVGSIFMVADQRYVPLTSERRFVRVV